MGEQIQPLMDGVLLAVPFSLVDKRLSGCIVASSFSMIYFLLYHLTILQGIKGEHERLFRTSNSKEAFISNVCCFI